MGDTRKQGEMIRAGFKERATGEVKIVRLRCLCKSQRTKAPGLMKSFCHRGCIKTPHKDISPLFQTLEMDSKRRRKASALHRTAKRPGLNGSSQKSVEAVGHLRTCRSKPACISRAKKLKIRARTFWKLWYMILDCQLRYEEPLLVMITWTLSPLLFPPP